MAVKLPPERPERLCPRWFGRHDLPPAPSAKNAVGCCGRCGRWFRSKFYSDNVAWCGYIWARIWPWNFKARRVKGKP